MDNFGQGHARLTMLGIKEAEKMEAPLFKKFAENYPFLHHAFWSIATALIAAFLIWLVGLNN